MTSKKYPMGYNPVVLAEIYEKENRIRTNWFYKNWDLLKGLTDTATKPTEDAEYRRKEMLRSQLKQMRTSKRFIKAKGDPLAIPPPNPNIILDIMRPVDPSVTELMYEKGGEVYLEERVSSAPDHRYYLPEATSFDYGWTSDALQRRVYRPPHGRSTEAMRSLYRRQNVRPDSPDLRQPYRSGPLEFDNL